MASAQSAPFTDPANLRGERVSPRTGRELPIDQGARGLEEMLRKLNTRASLMLIVAHPDDEDGGMLTLYSRGLGARVANMTLTRGEGGQNAVTGDFEDALGLIRTQELLGADRYMGADQMFGTEVDFGFSKTKEESFAKWTHERVLYDVVRAVRLYRPLVIAAVFIGGVTDGHGQHQVSGEIAQEVFKAAADPKVFPELTAEGILPWAPLKVYGRVPTQSITPQGLFDYATGQYAPARFTNYVTGEVTTTAPSVDVVVHEGETDPLLSGPGEPQRSYVQFARIGLGLQKTQIGPGVRLTAPGTFDIGYHRYGSRLKNQPEHEQSFFDGIDTSIDGIATLAPAAIGTFSVVLKVNLAGVSNSIKNAQADSSHGHPESSAPRLSEALITLDGLIANLQTLQPDLLPSVQRENVLHELRVKRVQLNDALALALGLRMEAQTGSPDLLVGSVAKASTTLTENTPEPLLLREALTNSAGNGLGDGANSEGWGAPLLPGKSYRRALTLSAADAVPVTEPYFFRTSIEQPVYQLRNPALRNAAQTPPALTVWAELQYRGQTVRLGRIVEDGEQPVSFVPPLSIALQPAIEIVSTDTAPHPLALTARVITNVAKMKPRLELSIPDTWKINKRPRDFTLALPGDAQAVAISVLPTGFTDAAKNPNPVPIRAYATNSESADRVGTDLGYRAVGYPGLPYTNFYTPAVTRVLSLDLRLPTHCRIAYFPGTGDAVPEVLASLGLPVTTLAVADLTSAKLSQFDTVILGVRTYSAHPDLRGPPTQALLDFARNGGNVIVQYQTADFTASDAPYPLALGSTEKVVDETAPVQLLQPDAKVFTSPNRLSAADFKGWIEERGHGFLSTWDSHYTAVTETHDPEQAPQRGGLLTTQLGRGHWTYCAFALYRQLPEAVPGSFRLFANLLGLAD